MDEKLDLGALILDKFNQINDFFSERFESEPDDPKPDDEVSSNDSSISDHQSAWRDVPGNPTWHDVEGSPRYLLVEAQFKQVFPKIKENLMRLTLDLSKNIDALTELNAVLDDYCQSLNDPKTNIYTHWIGLSP